MFFPSFFFLYHTSAFFFAFFLSDTLPVSQSVSEFGAAAKLLASCAAKAIFYGVRKFSVIF